jgi:hypothetical protein
LVEAQRFADASTQLVLLTSEAPSYAEAWLLRGSLEFQSKKLDDAQASLRRYTAFHVDSTRPDYPNDGSPATFHRALPF